MANAKRIARIILAIIVGEAALVMLTTVAQEILFNGIDYYTSAPDVIIIGGFLTFVAAVISGIIAASIVKGRSTVPSTAISFIIVLEMAYLMASGLLTGPVWFDVLAGLSLILGIWLGFFVVHRFGFRKSPTSV